MIEIDYFIISADICQIIVDIKRRRNKNIKERPQHIHYLNITGQFHYNEHSLFATIVLLLGHISLPEYFLSISDPKLPTQQKSDEIKAYETSQKGIQSLVYSGFGDWLYL